MPSDGDRIGRIKVTSLGGLVSQVATMTLVPSVASRDPGGQVNTVTPKTTVEHPDHDA